MEQNNMETNNQILEAALHYAELGLSVIPVGRDKKPLIEWKKYQEERASHEQIKEWWAQFPDVNVGVVTGKISGIVVVDVESGGDVKNLPPTVISKTGGGGWHCFYLYPNLAVQNGVRVRELTDMRGDGGYVVIPPSLHKSGNRYEWLVSPNDADFAELPEWVLQKTSKQKQKTNWQEFISRENPNGARNMSATQLAGKLLYHIPIEFWDVSGWATMKEWNAQNNQPPLTEGELRGVWDSIKQLELGRREKASSTPTAPTKRVFEAPMGADVTFAEWRETVQRNFPELVFPAEVSLAVVSQILITEITNPFALVLVDVPASGKTITLNFFAEIEGLSYATDKFTPASFVSNAANVKKKDLQEVDLLPRIQYKTLLVRDFATLFSKRDDDLAELMGLLTRVLDGEGLNTDSGVHGKRHYVGEYLFMMLGASTPIPPKVWKLMGALGSRLFFLRMNAQDKSEEELIEQLVTQTAKNKERECRTITKELLYTLWRKYPNGFDWDRAKDKKEFLAVIVRCAQLLAHLRGNINVWKEWDEEGRVYNYNPPTIEKPDRINQLLYNLARGHALVCGRTQINEDDLKLVIEIATDSAPTIRSKLFRKLLEKNGVMSTGEVEIALDCSKPTALKEMETLKFLGICYFASNSYGQVGEPEKEIHLVEAFKWFLGEECIRLRGIPLPPKQEQLLGGDG